MSRTGGRRWKVTLYVNGIGVSWNGKKYSKLIPGADPEPISRAVFEQLTGLRVLRPDKDVELTPNLSPFGGPMLVYDHPPTVARILASIRPEATTALTALRVAGKRLKVLEKDQSRLEEIQEALQSNIDAMYDSSEEALRATRLRDRLQRTTELAGRYRTLKGAVEAARRADSLVQAIQPRIDRLNQLSTLIASGLGRVQQAYDEMERLRRAINSITYWEGQVTAARADFDRRVEVGNIAADRLAKATTAGSPCPFSRVELPQLCVERLTKP